MMTHRIKIASSTLAGTSKPVDWWYEIINKLLEEMDEESDTYGYTSARLDAKVSAFLSNYGAKQDGNFIEFDKDEDATMFMLRWV